MHSTSCVAERNGSAAFPFIPDTATFTMTPGGWSYTDSGRIYRFDSDGRGPGATCRGLLEAWLPCGRYAVRWADWSLALEREELAALLAGDDAELKAAVRRDLFCLRMAIVLLRTRVNVHDDEVLIRNLDREAMRTITRVARRLSATVYRRGA
jgi:hypothetical protein